MFVNDVPYLTSITKALYYRTATPMPGMKDPQLFDAIDQVFRLYNDAGITITDIYADNQFKSLLNPVKDELEITIHNPPADGHVPEAERNNRALKERIRATYHRLPYKALPVKVMKILVMESASKLNYFPNKHGISKYYSPRQILHKRSLDCEHDCKYYFGQYVQAHEETTNTQKGRTKEAPCMRPIEGGHQV